MSGGRDKQSQQQEEGRKKDDKDPGKVGKRLIQSFGERRPTAANQTCWLWLDWSDWGGGEDGRCSNRRSSGPALGALTKLMSRV